MDKDKQAEFDAMMAAFGVSGTAWNKRVTEIFSRFVRNYMPLKNLDERATVVGDLMDQFKDWPEDILIPALKELVDENLQWMPTAGNISAKLKKVAEMSIHTSVWEDLMAEKRKLEQADKFDPAAWISLAARMDRAGMPNTAAQLRDRAGHYADVGAWVGERVSA